ncbi:hypothetical protein INT43_004825 [Umbelopsis isabellina]|uniref:Uncharacterized protein n=1 Tax=Mortierella isabellina TaxID=91625 RepID=A0A8H7UA98_MORIS|nr:hypothetical protein INT43_004825 [Umbelopsis isabellina]
MAAAHASAAQLNNTTVRLAAMTLKERQTASATGLAEASTANEASSSMNLAANENSHNELRRPVYKLIALAAVQRPLVFTSVSDLLKVVYLSLSIAVQNEAKWHMSSTDQENALEVLAEWNATLAKYFGWDEQKNQFLAPLQVRYFSNDKSIEHLVTYTSQNNTLEFLWSDEEEEEAYDIQESEDEESHHSNEKFGSATTSRERK